MVVNFVFDDKQGQTTNTKEKRVYNNNKIIYSSEDIEFNLIKDGREPLEAQKRYSKLMENDKCLFSHDVQQLITDNFIKTNTKLKFFMCSQFHVDLYVWDGDIFRLTPNSVKWQEI